MITMKRCGALLVLLSMIAAAHGLYSSSGPVLSLNKKTFQSQVLQSDLPAVVEFFAPWCGHCQQLAPTYTKVANNLQVITDTLSGHTACPIKVLTKRNHTIHAHIMDLVIPCLKVSFHLLQGMVTVAAVDCDDEKNKKMCGKYGVKGFPTIKVCVH